MFRVFALLIFLITFNNSLANANQHKLPTLNVVTEDWPPYNYLNSDGEVVGTATKQIKRMLELADINYTIKLLPWARSYNTAIDKPNTLIYSIYKIKEREPLFHWFCPLLPIGDLYAYALKDNNVTINSTKELLNYSVAVSRNEIEHTYLNNLGFKEGVNLYISAEDETSLDHVLNQKVQLFIESPTAIESRLNTRGLPSNLVVPVFKLNIEGGQHCFALSKNSSPEILKRVTEAFEGLEKEK